MKFTATTAFLFAIFLSTFSFGQYLTFADTLNCQNGTPTFVVDLSANVDSTWISPPQTRDGDCCGTDNNCVQFEVTLNAGAQGINFYIPSSNEGVNCGASPTGALFYQVNCGPLTAVGTPLCLNGVGPHTITFCKPGNNANCYAIQSIAGPSSSGDVVTADGCTDTLAVGGLENTTITWNSLGPGAPGDYNGLLSNIEGTAFGTNGVPFVGWDTVVVTPGFGAPPTITYEVCGMVYGFCDTIPFCDTVSVSIFPTLFADIQPDPVAVCAGGLSQTLTANPIGGTAPYTYLWASPVDPTIDGSTTQNVDVTIPGEYSVIIGDSTGCPFGYDTVIVTQYTLDISVDAGPDISICGDPVPTVQLTGSSPVTNAAFWDNYGGTFSTNDQDTIATYTPSAGEIAAGFAELYLYSDNNQACPGDTDTVIINLTVFTANLNLTPTMVSCNGGSDGAIDLTITGTPPPFTHLWSTSDISEDISGLSASATPYSVVVTDGYGCVDSVETVITEPPPIVITINGDNILCNGDADGNVTGTISGGTAPYTITLDQTGATQVVAASGGAYDFGSLSAAISGGFDTYTVTVNDANSGTGGAGCTAIAGPVNMVEPAPIVVTIIGDNLLCNGDADGNVTGTISGGTAPYTITLDQTGATQAVATDGGAYDFTGLSAAISGGFDTYNVTVTDANGTTNGCLAVAGPVNMIEPEPIVITISGDNLLCNGDADGNVTGTISGGTAPYTITLDQTGATQAVATDGGAYDFSGLSAAISGGFDTYTVTVTDANSGSGGAGCSAIAGPVNMVEPLPIVITINGDNLLCNGDGDGNVTGTVSGGTAPYVVTLDQTGATFNVGVDGGAYDFTGLSAAISGGFDTYTVTVTDANIGTGGVGCTAAAGPVNMLEPAPIVITINGDAILCNGDANGNVTGTISGGTAPYTITLDQTGATLAVATDGGAYDFSGLSSALTGGFNDYTVTVTDANGTTNGCLAVAGPVPMTEPLPITINLTGDSLLCFGDADGNVTGTITGGTAPYTVTLDQTGASQAVATDGGSFDFGGLSAAISGGFDNYTVTVTDANGVAGGCLEVAGPVAMYEPLPITITIAGDAILCLGDADGNVTGTISGGTAPYTIILNQTGATLNVATDGGAYDFSGLSSALGGGFNQYTVTVSDANGGISGCTATAGPVDMLEPSGLTLDTTLSLYAGGYNVSGCANDGWIDLTVTGGVGPYTYDWNIDGTGDFDDLEDISNLPEGNYSVVVEDANGCQMPLTVFLDAPDTIQIIDAVLSQYNGGVNISCNGGTDGSIDLTATGGVGPYLYDWDNDGILDNDDPEDLTNIPAGTYTVIVIDQNGCTGDTTVTLVEPLPLVATITGDNILCNGDADGNVSGIITGGTAPYIVTLDQTGATINVAADGGNYDFTGLSAAISGGFDTYTITVTDANGNTGGCLTIAGPVNMIEPAPIVVTVNGDALLCNGDADGNVTGTITGGTAPYVITLDQTGATLNILNDGDPYDFSGLSAAISGGFDTYSVTVTDANGFTNGCLALAGPVNMTEPAPLVVTINGDAILCNGDADGNITGTITGGTAPYIITLDQTGATLNIVNDGDPYDFSGLSAAISGGFDNYSVTVTDANGVAAGCLAVAGPVPMTEPSPLVVTINGDALLCNGDADGNVTGTVSGGTAPYTVTLDQTGTIINVAVDGGAYDFSGLSAAISGGFDNYSVTVTDANGTTNGCLAVAGPVPMTEPAPLVVTINGDVILCNGDADGNVTGTITGGTAPYLIILDQIGTFINLATDGGTYNFTGLSAAISGGFDQYSITVTDANGNIGGCSAIAGPVPMTEPAPLVVTINGDNILCNGDADGNVTGTVSGGTAPYVVTLDQTGATINVATDGGAYDFSGLSAAISGGFDTYSVTVTDANGNANGCLALAGPVNMIEPLPLLVTINGDAILCNGDADGNVTGTVSGGTAPYTVILDQTGTSINVAVDGGAYDFTGLSAAISGGFDNYSVTVTDANGTTNGCLAAAGPVPMTEPAPLVVTINGDAILCNGDADGNVTGTISGGTAPYVITLDQTGATLNVLNDGDPYDFSGLSAAISGGFDDYSVTVTDANGNTNGCLAVAGPVPLTEPAPLVVTINGDALLCYGDADGNVTGTISGGTAPYIITLDQTGTILNILNDGDAYDFSGLSAAISGGFDQYSVTVTDANGTTNGCLAVAGPVNMIEPLPFNVTINGDALLCNGDADGNVTGTISGGTAPYTVVLDQTGASIVVLNDGDPYDFSGLSAAISGGFDQYTITVTDANGALGGCAVPAGPVNMIEPAPIVLTINGDAILCNGDGSGNVTGTVSGGTAPYFVVLDQTGQTIQVLTDGGSYDFSGLNAAISGGFDQYSITVYDANGAAGGCSAVAGPVNMVEPLPIIVTINGDALLCNGDADGNVTGTISGGTAPYTITLDQTGATLNVLNDGDPYDFSGLSALISGGFDTYTVTVTDANGTTGGCLANAGPVDMIEPLPLVVTINGDALLCNGDADGNITGTVSGGTAPYTVILDETGATFVVLTDGGAYDFTGLSAAISGGFDTYNVTVTDANGTTNGCLAVAGPVNMIEPAPLVVTINGDSLLCNGDADGNITGTVSGGTAPYIVTLDQLGLTINVANDGDPYDFSGLSAAVSGGFDNYSVTVTDANGTTNGCLAVAGPAPMYEPQPIVVTINGDVLLCNGNADGNITGTVSGGTAPYTVTLDQTLDVLVVATDGGAYDFSGLSAAISGGFDQYSVTVTDANGNTGGCLAVAGPVNMTEPAPLVVTINGDALLCNGDGDGNVTGTISGGTAPYIITLDQTGAPLNILNDGDPYDFSGLSAAVSGGFDTYSVTVTDANGTTNGCLAVAGPVDMVEPQPLVVTILGDSILCYGDADGNVTGTISGGTAPYVITLDQTGATLNVVNDGDSYDFSGLSGAISGGFATYSVTVTDANSGSGGAGCSATAGTVDMFEPDTLTHTLTPSVYAGGYNVTGCQNDGTLDLEVFGGMTPYTYDWDNDGVGDFDDLQDLANLGEGTYTIVVIDDNGCTFTDNIFLDAPDTLQIVDVISPTYPSGDNISCFGFNDGSINLTVTGGATPYTIDWDNDGVGDNDDTEDLSNLIAGTYAVTVYDLNNCAVDTFITLIEPTPLVQDISAFVYPNGDNISCFGLSDGSIDYTISGGSPSYLIDWDNDGVGDNDDTEDLSNIPAGAYNVIVTDTNGCVIDTTITLTEPPILTSATSVTSNFNGWDVSCHGSTDGSFEVIIGGGSPNYIYNWTDGTGAFIGDIFNPSNFGAGTYYVTATDINGCTIDDSITLNEPPPYSVDVVVSTDYNGEDISCFGATDGGIDLTVGGGTPNYSYEWINQATGAIVSNLEDPNNFGAETYEVTITDANGCAADTVITLTGPDIITSVTSVITDYNGQDVSCFGFSDGGIDVVATGGTPAPNYSYVWTDVATGQQAGITDVVNGVPAGTYDVLITDGNGCTATNQIVVTEPPQITTGIQIISDYNGLPVSCAGQSDGEIQATPGGGTPGYTYSWNTNPPQDTQNAVNLPEGTYTVTVTDANGCQIQETITLIGNPLPVPIAGDPQEVCLGEMASIESLTAGGAECEWFFDNGMYLNDCGPVDVYFDDVGCYSANLVVTDGNGCIDSIWVQDMVCIAPLPTAGFTVDNAIVDIIYNEVNFTNTSTGAYGYVWTFGDGSGSTETHPTHSFPNADDGTYTVTLLAYSDFGCEDEITMEIVVEDRLILYVPNTFTPDFDDYNQFFTPVLSSGFDPQDYNLYIYNRWGELIFESHNHLIGWDGTYGEGLNTPCQDGTYTWKLVIGEEDKPTRLTFHGHVNLIR